MLKSVFRKSTSAHILSVDTCDLRRPHVHRSNRGTEFVPSRHTPVTDTVAHSRQQRHIMTLTTIVRPELPAQPTLRTAAAPDGVATELGRPGSDVPAARVRG